MELPRDVVLVLLALATVLSRRIELTGLLWRPAEGRPTSYLEGVVLAGGGPLALNVAMYAVQTVPLNIAEVSVFNVWTM